MKNQAWRRDPRSYDFFQENLPRYADIDNQRHVNNVAVFGIHAEACMRFQLHVLGEDAWQSAKRILHPVHAETNFLQVAHYLEPVQCGVRLIDVNQHDCTLATGLFQSGACVGIHEQRLVQWSAGQPQPMRDEVRLSFLACQNRLKTMASPSIARRSGAVPDLTAYSVSSTLAPRFSDFDVDGCTSTLALTRYAAQARGLALGSIFNHPAFAATSGSIGMRVGRTTSDIVTHRRVQGDMRLSARVAHVGNSSLTLRTGLFDQMGCMAVGDTVMVFVRFHDGRPTPMPQDLRDHLVEHGAVKSAG